MTEPTNVPADANADPQASGDTDAQLEEMQVAEQKEVQEPAKEAEPGDPKEHEVKKVVPLAALHEERRERQRLAAQLAETTRQHGEAMQRINQRLEVLTPKAPAIDPNERPVEYLDQRLNEVAQTQQQILQRDQERQQSEQQSRVVQELTSRAVNAEAEFAKTAPDYVEAIKHLDDMRVRELQLYGADEAQAREQVAREKYGAALRWANQGLNPAHMAYQLAQARGYTPKAAASAEQKIVAQQKGTAAAKSLGGGGAATAGKLTAEALANMSNEEFAALTESQFRQAMGG